LTQSPPQFGKASAALLNLAVCRAAYGSPTRLPFQFAADKVLFTRIHFTGLAPSPAR